MLHKVSFFKQINNKIKPFVLYSSLVEPFKGKEWEEIHTRDGRISYFNNKTRETIRLPMKQNDTIDNNTLTTKRKNIHATIEGHESQIVHIQLKNNEKIIAETGAMLYMTEGIEMETSTGGGLGQGLKRMMTGENLFISEFTYQGKNKGTVGFGTGFPSKILKLSLSQYNESIICQRGAFLCGAHDTKIEMEFTKKFGIGFFGEGFVLQKLSGSGDVFIKGSGAIIKKYLNENEILRVSTGSIVCFENTITYDITTVKGGKNILFGGEGLFLTTLTGPGTIYLQGLPFDRMVSEIAKKLPSTAMGSIPIGLVGGAGNSGAGSDDINNNNTESIQDDDKIVDNDDVYGATNDDEFDTTDSQNNNENLTDIEDMGTSIKGFFKKFFDD